MRKFLALVWLASVVGLTGCNTISGVVDGVGKDISAVGERMQQPAQPAQ